MRIIRYLSAVIFIAVSSVAHAQSVERTAVISCGSFGANPSVSVESSMGELQVNSFSTASIMLSQGFVQCDPLLATFIHANAGAGTGKIYPNPVVQMLFLEVSGFTNDELRIEMIDVLGKTEMVRMITTGNEADEIFQFDLSALPEGIYFMRVSSPSRITKVFKLNKI